MRELYAVFQLADEAMRASASVPVHAGVKVNAPFVFVMLRRRFVSDEVAIVSAPVCAVPPPNCCRERTPVLATVTAPVAPDTLIPVPATADVTKFVDVAI